MGPGPSRCRAAAAGQRLGPGPMGPDPGPWARARINHPADLDDYIMVNIKQLEGFGGQIIQQLGGGV